MRRDGFSEYLILSVALAAVSLVLPASGYAQSCPKLSQASLSLDNTDCPSSFGASAVEKRTSWALSKTAATPSLSDPSASAYAFNVAVTEGATSRFLVGTGQLVLTNGGELDATLWSVVANLQTKSAGEKFTTVASAVANRSVVACSGSAPTCFGTFQGTPGASLVLMDPHSNDVVALNDILPVPPSTCANAVRLNFVAEFSSPALTAGQQARLELLITFGSAGGRGNSPEKVSCTADVNCNGLLDGDDSSTCNINESESNNIRTIPVRNSFVVPPDTPVCATVNLSDRGAASADAACVAITPAASSLATPIAASGSAGATSLFSLAGTANCAGSNCATQINNTATLTCAVASLDPSARLINGSPASASIAASCGNAPTAPPAPGSFCSFTQGGWGSVCRGSNPGCFRDTNFASVFASGLFIGQGVVWDSTSGGGTSGTQDGSANGFAAKWTTAAGIENFLPATGTPGVLTADLTNALSTSAGVFAGQLVAATLNAQFDLTGKFDALKSQSTDKLINLKFVGGCGSVPMSVDGMTVLQVLNLAEAAISGVLVSAPSLSDLNDALDALNNNFDGCKAALGCLQ